MLAVRLTLIAAILFLGSIPLESARADEDEMEITIRQVGPPPPPQIVRTPFVDEVHLRGDQRDPDFVERSWAKSMQSENKIQAVTTKKKSSANAKKSAQVKAKSKSAVKVAKVQKIEKRSNRGPASVAPAPRYSKTAMKD